jgi:hypothetical protein
MDTFWRESILGGSYYPHGLLTYLPYDKDDSMQLNKRATHVGWCDLSHPNWNSSEDHECTSASEEAEHKEPLTYLVSTSSARDCWRHT